MIFLTLLVDSSPAIRKCPFLWLHHPPHFCYHYSEYMLTYFLSTDYHLFALSYKNIQIEGRIENSQDKILLRLILRVHLNKSIRQCLSGYILCSNSLINSLGSSCNLSGFSRNSKTAYAESSHLRSSIISWHRPSNIMAFVL